jgi:phosphatidylinositol alpha-1,6-mannosyltransferase
MRILFIQPPAKSSHHADALRRMPGAQVTTVGERTDPRRQPDIRLEVIRVPYLGARDRWTGALAWLRGLDTLDSGAVDIVVSIEAHSVTTAQAQKLARRLGVPHVVTSALCLRYDVLSWWAPPWALWSRRMIKRGDAFLCQTQMGADVLVDRGVPRSRTFRGLPGVDTDLFRPAAHRATEPIVTCVGELRSEKGVLDVVAAAEVARSRIGPGFKMVLIGDGPLREELDHKVASSPWLEVRGAVPRSEIARMLQESRAFILAPFHRLMWCEQLGYASIEAMASGLPIVITRSGATPEVVPAYNALVREHDIEGLAAGIVASLAPEADEWGRRNREHVLARYDLTTQAKRLHEFLSGIVGT